MVVDLGVPAAAVVPVGHPAAERRRRPGSAADDAPDVGRRRASPSWCQASPRVDDDLGGRRRRCGRRLPGPGRAPPRRCARSRQHDLRDPRPCRRSAGAGVGPARGGSPGARRGPRRSRPRPDAAARRACSRIVSSRVTRGRSSSERRTRLASASSSDGGDRVRRAVRRRGKRATVSRSTPPRRRRAAPAAAAGAVRSRSTDHAVEGMQVALARRARRAPGDQVEAVVERPRPAPGATAGARARRRARCRAAGRRRGGRSGARRRGCCRPGRSRAARARRSARTAAMRRRLRARRSSGSTWWSRSPATPGRAPGRGQQTCTSPSGAEQLLDAPAATSPSCSRLSRTSRVRRAAEPTPARRTRPRASGGSPSGRRHRGPHVGRRARGLERRRSRRRRAASRRPRRATSTASRVLPAPPGPRSVRERREPGRPDLVDEAARAASSRPTSGTPARGQAAAARRASAVAGNATVRHRHDTWWQVLGPRHVGQPVRAEVDDVPPGLVDASAVEQGRGRRGDEGLPAGCRRVPPAAPGGRRHRRSAARRRGACRCARRSGRGHPAHRRGPSCAASARCAAAAARTASDRAGERGEEPLAVGGDGQAVRAPRKVDAQQVAMGEQRARRSASPSRPSRAAGRRRATVATSVSSPEGRVSAGASEGSSVRMALLQGLEGRAGLEAELLAELVDHLGVEGERVDGPALSVETRHRRRPQSLAERVARAPGGTSSSASRSSSPGREEGLGEVLQCRSRGARPAGPPRAAREGVVGEVGQRRRRATARTAASSEAIGLRRSARLRVGPRATARSRSKTSESTRSGGTVEAVAAAPATRSHPRPEPGRAGGRRRPGGRCGRSPAGPSPHRSSTSRSTRDRAAGVDRKPREERPLARRQRDAGRRRPRPARGAGSTGCVEIGAGPHLAPPAEPVGRLARAGDRRSSGPDPTAGPVSIGCRARPHRPA